MYAINLDDKNSKGTHWDSLFIEKKTQLYNLTHLEFRIENIPQEVLNKIKDKSITHNIFRIQDNEYIMCRCCCVAFIEYMLTRKA